MKNIIITLVLTMLLSSTLYSQKLEQTVEQSAPVECPAGTHAVLTYSCELAFHRPKFDCESGFWFCCGNGQWTTTCVPNSQYFGADKTGKTSKIKMFVEVTDQQFIFHFNASLKNEPGYSNSDLQVFNVDDALIFSIGSKKYQLITGDYSTIQTDLEIKVIVPVKLL